ncbi:PREDICTED: E3 ubiquitin-protein ligase rnf213-alpha-like [Amphimedon queenslandica]|nr:PREDICTED: E3 ubiquitin-protein ligase rnf213-alpha-like [Amphimedon queenslandica]|eukprot:XP_019850404.1 PREDICTED: E3 ubiquitin-protein ligase rnf213-alpha-like [Amphimedon queenslandica]
MRVQFNAVIQKDIWKWEEGRSEVYIRFGHKMLGDWELDIGPCILHRDAGNGFYVIRYDMSIDSDFIKSLRIGLPYKYTVYSPLVKVTKHQFEYLHGAPPYQGANANRLLKVPKEKLCPGGYYRQFDTMILPDTKVKTAKATFKRVWDFISRAEPDDPTAITLPIPTLMRSQCMEIHLQPIKDILLRGDFRNKLEVSTNGCVNLIRCAYLQWVEHRGGDYRWEIQDIGPFLMDLVEFFLVDLNKQRDSAYHTVTSAVFLNYCLHKLRKFYSVPISVDLCIKLLQTMNLSYINGEKELSFLMSLIGGLPETRTGIVNALVYCLRTIIASENPDNAIVVLKALPLYHFLCDLSVPYQKSCVPLNKITWGDTSLLIDKLLSTLQFKSGFVQKHKEDIQQLLQFDSKLLYIIPYICPWEDTVILCDMLPLELAIVWLIERLNLHSDTHYLRLSSVTDYKMNYCFKLPLANILKRIYEKKINNFDVLVWYSDATTFLYESFRDKINFSINAEILVESTISLYLHILFKAKMFQDQTNNQDTLCQRLTLSARELLMDWVARKDVIGGSFFGASLKYAGTIHQELRKENDELKFWKELLFIKFPANEMKNDFEAIVLELVSDRVSEIPSPELKINLFINVDHREEIADSFRNIFLTKAIEALDSMFSKRSMTQSIQRWATLLDLKSERVFKLISKIIEKRYPDFCRAQEMPFSDLLDWEMWPGILKISYAQVGKNTRELGEWRLIVTCAISKLETVCVNINSGGITITELNSIRAKQIQMNKLCEVIDESRIIDLQKSIEKRLKEFEHFEEYTMKLKYFLSHICNILTGQYNLMDELQKNYKDEKINKLCITVSDGSCRVVSFPDARPLDPCLDGFFIISSKYSSDIFNRLWHKRIIEQPAAVDSSKIYSIFWQPVLQSCTLLLKRLQSGDMTLLEVDDQFKNVYFHKLDKLEKDLINLQHAVDAINHSATGDINWIKNAVVHIGQYWDLCGYKVAAKAFLKIRDTLDLTGDFDIVEKVALKVSFTNTTLSTIDHSVVDAGRFLQEYATDPAKRECLEVFIECQNIVQWIRNKTKDLISLFNFVSSSVAGREGSMAADKLLFLYTVGSGFCPLIYKLSKDASCQKLQELCKTVWMALETAPYLPDLMKSCERDIDWYKSFKEKHKTKIN